MLAMEGLLKRPVDPHTTTAGRGHNADPPVRLLVLQRAAGNAAVNCLMAQRCGPRDEESNLDEIAVQRRSENPPAALDPLRQRAHDFLAPFNQIVGWDYEGLAAALRTELGANTKDYAFIRAVFDEMPSSIEDNVGADLVAHTPVPISVIGLTTEGRALLDVLYEAIITGSVSDFQRKQADRIIDYRRGRVSQAEFVAGMETRMIFPIRNIGITKFATATFTAGMQPNGKVKIRYTSVSVTQDDMFKADLQTLPGWTQLSNGIELPPNHMVAVRLYDVPGHPIDDIPALGLIDYANQIKEKTLGTAMSAFTLGLTLGAGGLGGAAAEGVAGRIVAGNAAKAYLWGVRALVWADRVQFAIQAGAMIINDHRDWIVDTFPKAGPALLDAVDTANRLAGYYGWGRLGVDGIRLIRAKLGPAADAWRSARAPARLGGDPARVARAVEDEADTLLAELQYAEEKAASKGDRGSVTPPVGAKARKTVAGGEKEVHITNDRIEICPVQRCPDLREELGTTTNDPNVSKEVKQAEAAAQAGDPVAAADHAEQALIDAGKATAVAGPHAHTPAGIAVDVAEKARPMLSKMGLARAQQDQLLAGTAVLYTTPQGVICIAQITQGRFRFGIFSINVTDNPIAAIRAFTTFRQPALDTARALNMSEYELFGAAVHNPKIESMLNRQGFTKTTEFVPESFGLGPDTEVDIWTKRFPIH